jgi:hypothetical protein
VQFCVLPHAGEHAERCGMLSPRRRKLRLRIGDNISPMTRVARDGIGPDGHAVEVVAAALPSAVLPRRLACSLSPIWRGNSSKPCMHQ